MPVLLFYQFTIYRFFGFAIFRSHQFQPLSVLTFYNFACAPAGLIVLPFRRYPSIGILIILVSQINLLILVTWVIPATIPWLVDLGSLEGTAILSILVFLANLANLGAHVVIVTRAGLISLICLGLGSWETDANLAANKHTPTSRRNRSSHSSMRSHNWQPIQTFLPILPRQSFHTNHTGQYSQSIQQS